MEEKTTPTVLTADTATLLPNWESLLSLPEIPENVFPPCPEGVYLLHFDRPYKHASHYLGWSPDVVARIEKHRLGHGSGLTRALFQAGIGFVVARVWWGKGHSFERGLHDRKESRMFCPVCSGAVAAFRRAKG